MIEPKGGEVFAYGGNEYEITKASDQCEGCGLFAHCVKDKRTGLVCVGSQRTDVEDIIAVLINK